MREVAPVKISNIAAENGGLANTVAEQKTVKCRVRVSPGGYFGALFFLSFAAGFLNYLSFHWSGLILLVSAWTILPAMLWFDRIEFDGKSLSRKGFVAFLRRIFNSTPRRLKIAEIERIETHSLWTLSSGGRIYYRYSTEISGNEMSFIFASGGKNYRQMIRQLFPLVAEEKLDARSLELRDFLAEPDELERKIEELKLPSADILDSTLPKLKKANLRREERQNIYQIEENAENSNNKAAELRQAANELRIAGNLSQSIEAFRRALLWQPENPGLLYEFADALYAYANAVKNSNWARRAIAALRLAAKRGAQDAALLTRIGESYFYAGNLERAARTFRRALELKTENFRAECGLAEIGLQDGKIAHVVHHYQSAMRAAEDAAAKRWAQGEAEYFSLLNNDVEYMEAEISRIGWLNSATRAKRACLRLTIIGLLAILGGTLFNKQVAAFGWAISAATTMAWAFLTLVEKFLSGRFPRDEEEDE